MSFEGSKHGTSSYSDVQKVNSYSSSNKRTSETTAIANSHQNSSHHSKNAYKISFASKLYHMLENIENEGLSHIASWQPHGRAFMIHKPGKFIITIARKYFGQTKFASFQRQLKRHGFIRIEIGPDMGAYYHPNFLRAEPHLINNIIRIRTATVTKDDHEWQRMYHELLKFKRIYKTTRVPIRVNPKCEYCELSNWVQQQRNTVDSMDSRRKKALLEIDFDFNEQSKRKKGKNNTNYSSGRSPRSSALRQEHEPLRQSSQKIGFLFEESHTQQQQDETRVPKKRTVLVGYDPSLFTVEQLRAMPIVQSTWADSDDDIGELAEGSTQANGIKPSAVTTLTSKVGTCERQCGILQKEFRDMQRKLDNMQRQFSDMQQQIGSFRDLLTNVQQTANSEHGGCPNLNDEGYTWIEI